jgi:hypothetical protein
LQEEHHQFQPQQNPWNGSTWTTLPATMNTARHGIAGCGTQTAALGFGGYVNPQLVQSASESYNGTSWTAHQV